MNTTTTAYIVKSGFRAENQSRSILGCSALSSVFPGWKPDKAIFNEGFSVLFNFSSSLQDREYVF
jgi:hypothetical protein